MLKIKSEGEVFIEYTDPLEGFKGYLCIDGGIDKLAVGGFRVQQGLRAANIRLLAQKMSMKQRIIGINANGAKSGIDYDPNAATKTEAIRRFFLAIEPYIKTCYSIGSDLNTSMSEIEEICKEINIVHPKMAIMSKQPLSEKTFFQKINILNEKFYGISLGLQRSGYATACIIERLFEFFNFDKARNKVVIQGFGNMATGIILALLDKNIVVSSVSDVNKRIDFANKADLRECVLNKKSGICPDRESIKADRDTIFGKEGADILVLAASENAFGEEIVNKIRAKAVVCASNLPLSSKVVRLLEARGIMVIPDFVGGMGGSLSMKALFAPETIETRDEYLRRIDLMTVNIMNKIINVATKGKVTFSEAANQLVMRRKTHRGRVYF